MQKPSIWTRPLNSRFPEDREAAQVGLLMERTSLEPLPFDGTHPYEAARRLEYGTERVPLLGFDELLVSLVRSELQQKAYTWMLDRRLRDKRYDRTLLKALRDGSRLRPEQIDRMVAAYRRKLVRFRLETYTRFAMMDALSADSHQQVLDGSMQGHYAIEHVRRYWLVADDSRLCERCAPIPALNPTGVAFDGLFQTPQDGPVYRNPLCPRCRCTVYMRIERPGAIPPAAPGRDVMVLES